VKQSVTSWATTNNKKLSEKFSFLSKKLTELQLDLPSKRLLRLNMAKQNEAATTDNQALIPLVLVLFNTYMEEPGAEHNTETFIKNIKKTILSCSEQGLSIDEPVLTTLIDAIKDSLPTEQHDINPVNEFFNTGEMERLLWESHLTTYCSVDDSLKQTITQENLEDIQTILSIPAPPTREKVTIVVQTPLHDIPGMEA
jgi:hypothetical protein